MGLGKIWPHDVLPGLRQRVVKFATTKTMTRARFEAWAVYSRARYGDQRWIEVKGKRIRVRSDDWRAYWIEAMGGTQGRTIKTWENLLDMSDIGFDVGANYGEFCLGESTTPIIAIEANPEIFDCLQQTVETRENITPLHLAAFREDGGTIPFFFKRRMSGFSSLSSSVVASKFSPANFLDEVNRVEVPARTISSLAQEHVPDARCAVLKIDVEGFEDVVLDGAEEWLSGLDWWRAIIEFSTPALVKRDDTSVEEQWERFARFPGFVLQNAASFESLRELPDELATSEPIRHGDIVFGHGVIE